jgi:hypothetical protein
MSNTLALESFVTKWFGKMPPWLRAFTYLVAFLTWIYLLLSPSYLDGQMVVMHETMSEVPFKGDGVVSMYADGRYIKVSASDDGVWSIPVASRVPFRNAHIQVHIDGRRYPLSIPYLLRVKGTVRIIYDAEKRRLVIDPKRSVSSLQTVGAALISSAHAQVPAVPVSPWGSAEDARTVLTPGYSVDKAIAYHRFETTYGVEVPTEAWRAIDSPREYENLLANIRDPRVPQDFRARLRVVLESYLPEPDLHFAPNIPDRKLRNALERTKDVRAANDTVVALLDTTVLGSAKESLIFGLRGIYYRTSWTRSKGLRVNFIPYEKLAVTPISLVDRYEVSIGPDQGFTVAGSSIEAVKLRDILNSVRAVLLTAQRA